MDVAAAANATIEQLPVASDKENKNSAALYDQLVELEAQDGVIFNLDTFECEICFCDIGISDGIMIRNCLHQFCIECVRQLIISYEDADVICPASGCESVLQDREIRALLTQTEFDKYLVKTLRIAESKAANSYHCKRADCDGWCIVEDELNMFTCPQCSSDNCLSCRVRGITKQTSFLLTFQQKILIFPFSHNRQYILAKTAVNIRKILFMKV